MTDLATKYRPHKWSEVVGQSYVVDVLKKSKDWKSLLFWGPSGTGKTTVARLIGAYVNCESDANEVCGTCNSCKAYFNGSVDYREENVGDSRSIDAMRAVVDWMMYKPITLKKKVLVLDEVHNLSVAAQNLLLKVLEEPPPHMLIVLCTTKVEGIIDPLRQRCQEFKFKPVADEDLAKVLIRISKNEQWVMNLADDVLKQVFEQCEGSPRRFLTLLEKAGQGGVVNDDYEDEANKIVESVINGDVLGSMKSALESEKQLGLKGVIPVFISALMNRMKRARSAEEVKELVGIMKAMSLPDGLFGVKEEDRMLYQIVASALYVREKMNE